MHRDASYWTWPDGPRCKRRRIELQTNLVERVVIPAAAKRTVIKVIVPCAIGGFFRLRTCCDGRCLKMHVADWDRCHAVGHDNEAVAEDDDHDAEILSLDGYCNYAT